MRRWAYFLGAVALSPLVGSVLVAVTGWYTIIEVAEERRMRQRALQHLADFQDAVARLRAKRPSRYDVLRGKPIC